MPLASGRRLTVERISGLMKMKKNWLAGIGVVSLVLQTSWAPYAQGANGVTPCQAKLEKQNIGNDVPMRSWSDSRTVPWAVLLCVHGLGLHAGSYDQFGQRMAEVGVPTYAIDVRGFGAWQNTCGNNHVDFAAALEDVQTALEAVHKANPDLPVVLLGESMGGAIVVQATAMNPTLVDGLISCVPAGVRYGQKVESLRVALHALKGLNKPIDVGTKVFKKATEDEQVRESLKEDPGAKLELSPKELLNFQHFMNQNVVQAKQITKTPVLFVQGGNDHLVKSSATVDVFRSIGSQRKDFIYLGNAQHLIFEEGQFDDHVVDVVAGWIEKNVVEPSNVARSGGAQNGPAYWGVVPDKDNSTAKLPAELHDQALGHVLLGEGYLKLNEPEEAHEHLLKAITLARGTIIAKQAAQLLLSLPPEMIAPPVGANSKDAAEELKFSSVADAFANDKPSVVCFVAPWVEPCAGVDVVLDSVLKKYGDRVNVVKVDADNPQNDQLCKKYGIGPLPTVLYLSPSNEVVAYKLGTVAEADVTREIIKLLHLEQTSMTP